MFPPSQRSEVRLSESTATGVIPSVKLRKKLLRQCVTCDPHSYGLAYSLCWRSVPLIRFWPETGCPTCVKSVYSGFAEDEQGAIRLSSALKDWNRPRSDTIDAFAVLIPLFSYMTGSYYLPEDCKLYLADGNGHFFRAATNRSSSNPATVAVWDPEYCSFSDTASYFLLPGQPPSYFSPEHAMFYRDKLGARALAWYPPDSYLCVLLDGHHKAITATLEGRLLKTLVLSTTTHFNDEQQILIFPGGECPYKAELQYRMLKLIACKTLPSSV